MVIQISFTESLKPNQMHYYCARPFPPLPKTRTRTRTRTNLSFSTTPITTTTTSNHPSPPPHPPNPTLFSQLLISWTHQSQTHHPFDQKPHPTLHATTLHARILRLHLPLGGSLAHSLVDFYSKSGHLPYAERSLLSLHHPTTKAWNSLLSAHSRSNSPKDVILGFGSFRNSGFSPDQFTFAIVLSACSRLEVLGFGEQVHCDVFKSGFACGSFCSSSLIDMYAKCGFLVEAKCVFDSIGCPDTVAWTTMIAGCVRVDMPEHALDLFDRMLNMGNSPPDNVTFVTAISACVGLGRLDDAWYLFGQMPCPNAVAWNSIISGHAKNGHEEEALELFREMRGYGIHPTRSTLGSVLSAAANVGFIREGRQVHSVAVKTGLDSDVYVGSSLLTMYAKCGVMDDARKVFDTLDERNIVTWNAVMGGYVQNGQPELLLTLFLDMRDHGIPCDEFTYVSIFTACACLQNLKLGQQFHSAVIKKNFDKSLFVRNAIIDMYAKSSVLEDASLQFELAPDRDIVTWNAILVGHIDSLYMEEALIMFGRMMLEGQSPDKVSLSTTLSACADLKAFREGKKIHCLSIKFGLDKNGFVGSSVINFYAKLGELEAANMIFQQMPEKNVVSSNALIEGYVINDKSEQALKVFQQMLAEGIVPSELTFTSMLPACTGSSGQIVGQHLHCRILKSALLYKDLFLGVSLTVMYMRSQNYVAVNKIFSEVPYNNDAVFWTAIISGKSHCGSEVDSFFLSFSKMREHDVRPDQATFVGILGVCANVAAVSSGQEVQSLIIQTGYSTDERIGCSLIDMYSKCGDVRSSYQAFNELETRAELVLWNSMLVGFAQNGYAEEALMLFSRMKESKIEPDAVTFLGVLTACSHSGLISHGQNIFDSMYNEYGIKPRPDHYACIVDLLARGGHLTEAEAFIDEMPFEPDGVVWATLLSACRMHKDLEIGRRAAKKLIELEPLNPSPYVMLSNMCAASTNWNGVKMVRQAMNERKLRKSPGCSWITLGGKTAIFVAGDKSHVDAAHIYASLEHLTVVMKEEEHDAEYISICFGVS